MSFNKLELETSKKHLLLKQRGRCVPVSLGADRLTHCGFLSDRPQGFSDAAGWAGRWGEVVVPGEGRRGEGEGEIGSSSWPGEKEKTTN